MATFTESEITDLAEILGTNSDYLSAHLTYFASVISDSDKTRVLELVTEWQGITGNPSVRFVGNEANEGFNMSIGEYKANLATRIAQFVQFEIRSSYGNYSLVRA